MIRKYELMFVLDDRKYDDGGKQFARDNEALIEQLGGRVVESRVIGRQQLAHAINKRNTGIFINQVAELPAEKPAELREHYRLDRTVYRAQVYTYVPPPPKPVETTEND